jgi:dTDP-4-amino-4,6-dideoxygalactose transaminase
MINVFQPTLGDEELAEVRAVFDSGWIGRGGRTREFEESFAAHLGVPADRVTAVNSCTEGVFTAMELLDVGRDDEVVLPTISFVGAANAVAARGARPVFCDVDPRTLNPRVSDIEAKLTRATKAVLLLHYGGAPGAVADVAALCADRGVPLVEDTACAVASSVDGRACGTLGDIGVWSFDAMKILVAGDGGMVYCKDAALAARTRKVLYLGMDRASGFSEAGGGERWWEFDVSSFSRRSIINDVTAAIGSVQLRRVPDFTERRRSIARRYDAAFAGVPELLTPPALPPGHVTSQLFYWIQVDPDVRDDLARQLLDRGVYTTFRYLPLHRLPIYGSEEKLPDAEEAAERTLCLPMHQALDDAAVETVIAEVVRAVTELRGRH